MMGDESICLNILAHIDSVVHFDQEANRLELNNEIRRMP